MVPAPRSSSPRTAGTLLAYRDQGIDAWRAAGLLRVVLYHTLGWAWLTILFPAMGLMFALAGSLTARSLDRNSSKVIGNRLRRLLPPLWMFGAVATAVMFYAGWRQRPETPLGWWELLWWIVPVRTPPAGGPRWAWAFTAMLWYLVAYLWFVVLSRPMLAAFRRWPGPVFAVSLAIPVALHLQVISIGGYLVEPVANVSTYACCWLLGYAHHDGVLRRLPGRVFCALVIGLALVGAGWLFVVGAGQGDFDVNHVPVANSLWSGAFVAAILRFDLPIGNLLRSRWLRRLVDVVNARAVTIYLWHFAMLIAAQYLLRTFFRPLSPDRSAPLLATVLVLTGVATVAFGWVEDLAARRPPRLVPPSRGGR
jgi:peptidoglycan/LPS O-acetylase OafA/YrhL